MRKVLFALLAAVLIVCFGVTALATENGLELSAEEAAPGGTAYVTVSLTEAVQGDSMGITFTYDKAVLAPVADASFWELEGVLQDFNSNADGVWTVEKTTELKEQICVVAFRVLENVEVTETELACKLVIKNGSQEVGVYEATAKLTIACDHVFGYWHSNGEIGHYHSCIHCGMKETSSHNWSEGTPGVGKNEGKTCFVCQTCKAMRVVEPQSGKQDVVPSETEPAEDGRGHEHEYEAPYRDFNDPTSGHDHDHNNYVYDEHGNVIYDEHGHPVTVPAEDGEHDHDHVSSGGENGWVILLCVVLPVAAFAVAGVLFLKKKKK